MMDTTYNVARIIELIVGIVFIPAMAWVCEKEVHNFLWEETHPHLHKYLAWGVSLTVIGLIFYLAYTSPFTILDYRD